jgi:hypothetical protein
VGPKSRKNQYNRRVILEKDRRQAEHRGLADLFYAFGNGFEKHNKIIWNYRLIVAIPHWGKKAKRLGVVALNY